jgi:hypothetical protein
MASLGCVCAAYPMPIGRALEGKSRTTHLIPVEKPSTFNQHNSTNLALPDAYRSAGSYKLT